MAVAPITWSTRSSAEPSAADRATARALAEEGYRALSSKQYELAEDRFRRADTLVHAPTLVVDHARALVGLGRLAEAYEGYDSARRETLPPGAPGSWKRAVADAQREIKALESKIAWVTITVQGPAEPRVTIDEREVPAMALGSPFPADPGTRTVHASAQGFVSKDASVTLSAGAREQVDLQLEPVPPEPVAPPPPPKKRVIMKPPPAPPVAERKPSTLTYVAFGVGGAGLAVGAVTGILFLGTLSKLKSECPTRSTCPPSASGDLDRYYVYSYTSSISLLVGLAGAGAGVALLLTKPKPADAAAAKATAINPYVSVGGIGLEGQF